MLSKEEVSVLFLTDFTKKKEVLVLTTICFLCLFGHNFIMFDRKVVQRSYRVFVFESVKKLCNLIKCDLLVCRCHFFEHQIHWNSRATFVPNRYVRVLRTGDQEFCFPQIEYCG